MVRRYEFLGGRGGGRFEDVELVRPEKFMQISRIGQVFLDFCCNFQFRVDVCFFCWICLSALASGKLTLLSCWTHTCLVLNGFLLSFLPCPTLIARTRGEGPTRHPRSLKGLRTLAISLLPLSTQEFFGETSSVAIFFSAIFRILCPLLLTLVLGDGIVAEREKGRSCPWKCKRSWYGGG